MSREAELYRALLELGVAEADGPTLLAEALALLASATGASQAYVEVFGDDPEAPLWSCAMGLDEGHTKRVRALVSRGIIARAVATGESVITENAGSDPRFAERPSVREQDLKQVVCAPVQGPATGARGVVFLQGRDSAEPFGERELELTTSFGRYLWSLLDRIQLRAHLDEIRDPTRALREKLDCADLVGTSPAMASLLEQLWVCAGVEVPVLFTGETGCGKSQVARALHRNSARRDGPFVVVDCPSIPDTLFEAELFGALPGAYTGISQRREGLVRTAAGGTLFLDEVGDLSPANQARLLHFLEQRTYRPLGSDRTLSADVRVLSATNQQIRDHERFRQDLFWRIAGFEIHVPSLAERPADIPLLARAFAQRAAAEARCAVAVPGPSAIRALQAQEWPGNLRQLFGTVRQGVVRASARGDTTLEPSHLGLEPTGQARATEARTYQEQTRAFQEQMLRQALAETRWNVTETARRLDLTRAHVYNLIGAFGLEREPG